MSTTRQQVRKTLVQVTDNMFVAGTRGVMRRSSTAKGAVDAVLKGLGYRTEDERYWVRCVDLRPILTEVWAVAGKLEPELRAKPPKLDVHYRDSGFLGRAYLWTDRILLNRGEREFGSGLGTMVDTIIHEVAHFMAYCRGDKGHGDFFRAAEAELRADCTTAGITNTTGARSRATHVVD